MKILKLIEEIERIKQKTDSIETKQVLTLSEKIIKELSSQNMNLLREIEMQKSFDNHRNIKHQFYPQWKTKDSESWKCIRDSKGHCAVFETIEEAKDFLRIAVDRAKQNYTEEFRKFASKTSYRDFSKLNENAIVKTRIICREIGDSFLVKDTESDISFTIADMNYYGGN